MFVRGTIKFSYSAARSKPAKTSLSAHSGPAQGSGAPAPKLSKRSPSYLSGIPLVMLFLLTLFDAQSSPLSGSARIQGLLERVNTLGSLLMLGAHPDVAHSEN